ncbi:hypothetical protein D1007_11616 [Hordeum vulgare]|nr:hypothetical protein D1007_11616 [Hordeum vulgare]
MIDDLMNKIVKNDNTDDDFLRMTFLVLLGIIGKVLEDGRVREWPHGNLALLQYAYWEKVQPIIGSKYDPLSLMSPLMRNWTEPVAEKRDKYDYGYGRGVGMKMIEKMNKTGVFYRTGDMEEEEENLYDDTNESTNDGAFGHKEFVYQSDKNNYRTPSQGKINKQKDDDEGNVPYYCTLDFKGDWSDPIEIPEVSHEKAVTSLDTNEISSHESGHYNGVDEQVEKGIGKRKRTASRAIKSPFVVVKPIKHAKLSAKAKLFNKVDGKKISADVDVIKSSVMFVRACERSKKHKAAQIFNDGVTDALTAERACQILNRQWISGDTYMALNKDNTHWVTVVMHKEKEEFQILDSLMGKELDSTTRKLVEDLRREIGADIAEANATGSVQYPNVSTWPIKTYDMPQQEDG